MSAFAIKLLAYGAIGMILATLGATFTDWRYWAVLVLVFSIEKLSEEEK